MSTPDELQRPGGANPRWTYNMLGVARLPESAVVTTALCKLSTSECLSATHIEDNRAQVRVGVFATDASYWQFFLGYKGPSRIPFAFS